MIRYARILSEFISTPWAIQEEKLQMISSLILLRAEGGKLTEEEIQARVGGRESSRPLKQSGGVAVLPVYGVINHRMNMMSEMSGGTSIEQLTSQFRGLLADPSIGAIVLDIDSPGGGVSGVQELADEIFASRGQKRIVAQVNPLAASAAYWLAVGADEIVITPSGAAGSIGVLMVHEDVSKMLEQKGVKVTLLSAGKYKTEGNQTQPLDDEAKAYLQKRIQAYYEPFVGAVARGRGVTKANVREGFGQGRVANAQDAMALGMVDRIATLDQTIEALLGSKPRAAMSAASGKELIRSEAAEPAVDPADEECDCEDEENCECDKKDDADAAGEKTSSQQLNPATAEIGKESEMDATKGTPAAGAEVNAVREGLILAETKRAAQIQLITRQYAGMQDKAEGWIRAGVSVDTVLAEVADLVAKGAKPVTTHAEPGSQVTLTDREQKQFSILRAVRGLMARAGDKKMGADSDAGFEFEISDAIAKKLGRDTAGIFIPTNIRGNLKQPEFGAVMNAVTAPGSNLVQTTIRPDEFIELLRNRMVVMALGARKLSDLQGNIQLPKQTAAATLAWTGENPGSAVTASDQTIGNVTMSPKQAMAQTVYSRQFLIQSSLDAEQLIREDLAAIFAIGIDLAALVGLGSSNQPKGIVNQSGVNVVAIGTNGGALTYSNLIDAQTALENANIPLVSPGFASTPGIKAKLRKTAKLANTIADPIWDDDNIVAGYRAMSTNQLPANGTKGSGTALHTCITGDWAQLIVAEWGALEIIADPYTQAGKANVVLTGSMLVDIAVRYATAFTVISDADPTQ